MADHRRTTGVTSGGGSGWLVPVLLLLVIALGAFFFYNSGFLDSGGEGNVNIDVPADPAPATPTN